MIPWVRTAACRVGIALVVGCGGPPAQRLGPAGGIRDDGDGQLALASTRGYFEAANPASEPRAESAPTERADGEHGGDGLGFGGSGYGAVGLGEAPALPPPPPYTAMDVVVDGGSVLGAVRWKGSAGVAWPAACRSARVARSGAPVYGAVVYLDGVTRGRSIPFAMNLVRTGGVLVVDACALLPTVQVVSPLPGQIVIENSDRDATLVVSQPGGLTRTVAIAPGARQFLAVDRVGEVRLEAGGRAPAWAIGQAHPYYVVTDAEGRFALDDVPPGNYQLVIWYPPLVARIDAAGPQWTSATVVRRRVTVPKRGVARVTIGLVPSRVLSTSETRAGSDPATK